jgi:hypothetical protein
MCSYNPLIAEACGGRRQTVRLVGDHRPCPLPLGFPRAHGVRRQIGRPRVPRGVKGVGDHPPLTLGVHRADGAAKVGWVARGRHGSDGGQTCPVGRPSDPKGP